MLRVRCRAVITNPYGSHGLLQNMQQPYFYRHSPWASNRNRRLGKYLPTGGSYGLFPFHIDLYFKEVPAVIPQSKIRDFCQLPLAREPLECAPKPPLLKGGGLAKPNRGDTQAPPGYFLPNHSSLFPKKPSPFHIGLYFEEVSAVESLSRLRRQLPFTREPCGQCPLTIPHGGFLRFVTAPPTPGIGGLPKPPGHCGGGLAKPNRGDSEGGRFPHWFVL